MINLQEETWKPVNGYEDSYEVSNLGVVRTLERKASHRYGFRIVKAKTLSAGLTRKKNGYLVVNLSVHNKPKSYTVHRLVAVAFIPNPNNLPHINHIDGNPLNNRADNLEWVSVRENNCHRVRSQKRSSKYIGVHQRKWDGKYVASISHQNTSVVIGSYDNEIDAYNARKEYEKEHKIINKYL